MHILCCRLIFLAYAETLAYAKGQRREQLFVYICISVKPFFFFNTWPGKSSGELRESKEKCYVQPSLLRFENMNSFNPSNNV